MRFKTMTFVAMVTIAAPLFAQSDATPSTSKPAKVKKICRQEMATGSMFPKHTCRTPDEWKAIDQQNQDNAQNALSRRTAGRPG